jgi:hypothetical protein
MNQVYLDAVRLLLAIAPVIFRKPTFALKGGTAINLFVQDMPRHEMPAIRWKVENLSRLSKSNPVKFAHQAAELRRRLEV